MSAAWFERLSALDATFLRVEDESTHMHVGAVAIFDAAPLTLDHGGVDFDRIRGWVHAAIERVPRYRQRLATVPMLDHPVWVDDDRFNIHYHVRHSALPRPGDERLLKRLAGRVFSQKLDRGRPLWEFWVVEGLEGGRWAVISKIHHCMIDGMAGVGLMASLLRPKPVSEVPEVKAWSPRPRPGPAELARAEVRHRLEGGRKLWRGLKAAFSEDARADALERAGELASGALETVGSAIAPADKTPLATSRLGPHRRFDWQRMDLSRVKAVKDALGGKLNDVVLAIVAGGLRRWFERRGTDPATITDFRAFVPVATSSRSSSGRMGNSVSMMLAHLPIAEPDPALRLEAVVRETTRLKDRTGQVATGEAFGEVSDYTGATLIAHTARLAVRLRPYNIVVTNVPGPPFPLYLLEGRLQAIYPLVPLFGLQTVGVALFSYDGGVFWGLNADWEDVPDLHDLVDDLEASFEELDALARAA